MPEVIHLLGGNNPVREDGITTCCLRPLSMLQEDGRYEKVTIKTTVNPRACTCPMLAQEPCEFEFDDGRLCGHTHASHEDRYSPGPPDAPAMYCTQCREDGDAWYAEHNYVRAASVVVS